MLGPSAIFAVLAWRCSVRSSSHFVPNARSTQEAAQTVQ